LIRHNQKFEQSANLEGQNVTFTNATAFFSTFDHSGFTVDRIEQKAKLQ